MIFSTYRYWVQLFEYRRTLHHTAALLREIQYFNCITNYAEFSVELTVFRIADSSFVLPLSLYRVRVVILKVTNYKLLVTSRESNL